MLLTFSKKVKIISTILIFSLIFSLSPIFALKSEAQIAGPVAGAGIVAAAKVQNEITCFPTYLGSGYPCDRGVRWNTLQILSSSVGVGPGVAQKESVWDSLAYFAGRILVRQITQSIVDWINSGFEGNPSFVQNPQKFLTGVADRTIGEFIFGSDLAFLCDPFKINVQLSLGLQYRPFKDQINCTLTGILKNTENAYNDFTSGNFINGGGWDSWLQMTTIPQNNQLGAMILAQAEMDARIGDIQLAKRDELNWSGGLLSMKKCVSIDTGETYYGDSFYHSVSSTVTGREDLAVTENYGEDICDTVTPGSWISNQAQKITSLDLDRLGMADEINEIVGALANFLITKVMQKGFAGVGGKELSPNDSAWRSGITQLQNQQDRAISLAASSTTYQDNGHVNFNRNFTDRLDIISAIDEQIFIENDYLTTQNYIFQLLDDMQNGFSSASTGKHCTEFTKNEIISQIQGNYTGNRDLPWNKMDINTVSSTTINNLSILSSAKDAISTSNDNTVMTDWTNYLASINTFHSIIDINNYSSNGVYATQVRDWVISKLDAYANNCGIDYYNWNFI